MPIWIIVYFKKLDSLKRKQRFLWKNFVKTCGELVTCPENFCDFRIDLTPIVYSKSYLLMMSAFINFVAVAWMWWISTLHLGNHLHWQPCQEGFQFHVHWIYVFYVRFWTGVWLFTGRLFAFTSCGYVYLGRFYYAQYR